MPDPKRGERASPGGRSADEAPMTAAQRSYLKTLSEEAGVPFEGDLSRAEAARRVDELQDRVERLRGERKKG